MQQEQNFCAFRNGETCHINKLKSVKLSQILIKYLVEKITGYSVVRMCRRMKMKKIMPLLLVKLYIGLGITEEVYYSKN